MSNRQLTKQELANLDAKLEDMTNEVGVSLSDDEILALRDMLKDSGKGYMKLGQDVEHIPIEDDYLSVILETQEEGMCYLKLLCSLPSIGKCSMEELRELIAVLKMKLGRKPKGQEVILNLTLSELVLSGKHLIESLIEDDIFMFMNVNQHTEILADIMKSKACYSYEERDGVFHINDQISRSCKCNEIMCDHGWATRFIMTVAAKHNCVIGSNIDFSRLFVEKDIFGGAAQGEDGQSDEEEATETNFSFNPIVQIPCEECGQMFEKLNMLNRHRREKHLKPYICEEMEDCPMRFGNKKDLQRHIDSVHIAQVKYYCENPHCKHSQSGGEGFSRKDNLIRHKRNERCAAWFEGYVKPLGIRKVPESSVDTQSQRAFMEQTLQKDVITMMGRSLDERTALIEETLRTLVNERSKRVREESSSSNAGTDDEDVQSTIIPIDSSSQIGRYTKRFMPAGQVYTMTSKGTTLETVPETQIVPIAKDIVGGFLKTVSMQEEETSSNSKIYQINGLANPFRSPRLNFLAHFHTAFFESRLSSRSDPIKTLDNITYTTPRNPTEELMKQVIMRTFELTRLTVVANPFNLPFIEIGMLITESAMMKCLELLRAEYRGLWFQEMKCLKVPKFCNDFEEFDTKVPESRGKKKQTDNDQSMRTLSGQGAKKISSRSTDLEVRRQKPRRGSSLLGIRI